MRPEPRLRFVSALLAAVTALALAAAPVGAAGPSVWVVASGLDNARGIAVGHDGRIYFAEAGTGGPGGYGTTGRISVIDHGRAHVFAAGLPSALSPEGDVTGPVNVAFTHDTTLAIVGAGPQALNPVFDSVVRARAGTVVANIQAYVNAHPDTTDVDRPPNPTDSNAYGAASLGEDRVLVTDAANNTLLLVGPGGRIQTVAKFPNEVVSTAHLPMPLPPRLPAEAVPTSVAIGPDGYWYVGELKGFPFTPGESRIWRIAPWARNATCSQAHPSGGCALWMDGFTSITGLGFGPDGALYVVEIVKQGVFGLFSGTDAVGALYRVWHGQRTELIPGRLTLPADVAVARDGTVYVTNNSVSSGAGEVLAIKR
ncbi:MAG: ScyD/ScyE family protein [Chloroflexota bacterium]|nr:ScyD/ScyE family protein [Chloroflexota bacterium]